MLTCGKPLGAPGHARRKLRELLASEPLQGRPVRVLASPFSRTLRTARLAAEVAGLPVEGIQVRANALSSRRSQRARPARRLPARNARVPPAQVAPELRERYFGDELELQSYGKAYGRIWERDAESAEARPGGNGESVAEVAARVQALVRVRPPP